MATTVSFAEPKLFRVHKFIAGEEIVEPGEYKFLKDFSKDRKDGDRPVVFKQLFASFVFIHWSYTTNFKDVREYPLLHIPVKV